MENKLVLKYFKYTGYIGKRRKKTKGMIAAISKEKAFENLEKQSIKEVVLKDKTPFLAKYSFFSEKVTEHDLAMFFEKLASQMEVGISPGMSLQNFLTEGFKYNTLLFIYKVKLSLDEGNSVTDAMDAPGILAKDIVKLIAIGEESGSILNSFREIAKLFAEQAKIRKMIKKATYKPIGLMGFAFAILMFIVPVMLTPIKAVQSQFAAKGGLPLITQIVMGATDFIAANFLFIGIFIAGIIFTHRHFYKTNYKFKDKWDTFIFSFPIIGKFKRALAVYLTLLNLSILQRAGVNLEMAFKMISDAQKNEEYKRDIEEVRQALREGSSFESSISYSTYIPKVYKDIIRQGESTGRMVEELEKARQFAEIEFKETSELIISSFSKITGFLVTILIGIIIMAVYMPIFSMVGQVMETM